MDATAHSICVSLNNQITAHSSGFSEWIGAETLEIDSTLAMYKTRLGRWHAFIEGLTPGTTFIFHTGAACLLHSTEWQLGASGSFCGPRFAGTIGWSKLVSAYTSEVACTEAATGSLDAGATARRSVPF